MARTVSIGAQDFEKLVSNDSFYVDKTAFIKEWWERRDIVTLITRPRRFGKTLNMNMLERFFSLEYADRGELFRGLAIWEEEEYRELQGTYPVISLSFAGVKDTTYEVAVYRICGILQELYAKFGFLAESGKLTQGERRQFRKLSEDMTGQDAPMALHKLSGYLERHFGKPVIILLDEYDTPMQEAYMHGFWEELFFFMRSLFNNTFKTNPYMERAVMTGITRISKESMFSDLNNLNVAAVTSKEYASCFGFTQQEVFAAMDEFHMADKREDVKKWYDGFTIGDLRDIYNPWSVINFLDTGELKSYWANTSSNGLAGKLLRQGSQDMKMQFEQLLSGKTVESRIDEDIAFHQLEQNENMVFSLFLAGGYLKIVEIRGNIYEMALTNYEVKKMFENMVLDWFAEDAPNYNRFVKALLLGDVDAMNFYMENVAESMFSSFDTGNRPSKKTNPERFYHGFVLGLLVDLAGRYVVTSNRESGFGRYDVMLEPLKKGDDGILLEFKVFDPKKEADLEETVQAALRQMEEKKYGQVLEAHGLKGEHIRMYGLAFEGKNVLIGTK